MSTIPLPALDIKPLQQQPSPVDEYGNLMRLQAMQQQLANAPLERQQMQQQVQAGGLDIQQKQQQLNDQKAMTAAMQSWDGKDYNDILPLVIKNGGSAQAVMGLKSKILEQQQSMSTALKNNADAASAQMTAAKTKGDLLDGALTPLVDPKQTPDDQLPQAVMSTAQSLVQRGILDPQHAQQAAQLAQSGNPQQIRQQLDLMRKANLAQSQIMDDAQKQSQITSEQTNAAKNQAEAAWYAKNGGAPGVPAEMMQQADWIAQQEARGRKVGPSDYKLWTLRNTPTAMVMGNQLGGDQNQQALDFAAQNYRQTGQMPPGLYRSPGTITAIIQRASQLDQQEGGGGIAFNKANLQSNETSLKNLQKNYDQVQAFEQTASKNMDLLQQTASKIHDLGARFANIPVRMLNSKMLGTENMAAFNTALNTAQTEAAKVLNSSNASGVLSDNARHELQNIIDGNMSYKAMTSSLNTLKQDLANRTQSYQMQIGDIQNRIKAGGTQQPNAGGASAPAGPKLGDTKTFANGKTGKWDGRGWVAQ